jgi:hypothetical protein
MRDAAKHKVEFLLGPVLHRLLQYLLQLDPSMRWQCVFDRIAVRDLPHKIPDDDDSAAAP